MTPREFAIRIIRDSFGDDLERARLAFQNCTPEQMDQEYGESGQTRAEILQEYVGDRIRRGAALAWAEKAR